MSRKNTRLSVNVNKIALLRNSRGGNLPDLLKMVKDCLRFGADGITVHPRPDERHIRYQDVKDIAEILDGVELNVEGYPNDNFLKLIEEVEPAQCTLVPDPPDALTSDSGWDTLSHSDFLKDITVFLKDLNIRSVLFMDADVEKIAMAAQIGVDRIELYTGTYASIFPQNPQKAIHPFIQAAKYANEIGLTVNAGHDLNLENLNFLIQHIPDIQEVSIGHALIADALYLGLDSTIQAYQNALVLDKG